MAIHRLLGIASWHPSFAWHSILAAQPIVQKRHWQVGNGHSLNILKDKWLNQPSTFKLTSCPISVPFDAQVSLLIDPYTRAWKVDTITQLFFPSDAYAIWSIPLRFWLPCDQMVWAYTPKGDFTVRSAYKITLTEVSNGSTGETSDNQNRTLFWKTLWGLNVPNKVKSFAWRACRNIILTKANLCRQGDW